MISEIIRQLHDPVGPKGLISGNLCILLSGGGQDYVVMSLGYIGVHGITAGNSLDVGATVPAAL